MLLLHMGMFLIVVSYPIHADCYLILLSSEKWDAEDVEMLRSAVKRFGEELCALTDRIKKKQMAATSSAIKGKVFEESSS